MRDAPATVVLVMMDGCPASSIEDLPEGSFLRDARDGRAGECRYAVVETVFPSSTAAGHAAVFTGAYPDTNGVTGKAYLAEDGELASFSSPDLVEQPTLFETAKEAGYVTAVVSAKPTVRSALSKPGVVDMSIGPTAVPDWVLDAVGAPPDESTQYDDFAGWYQRQDRWILDVVRAVLERESGPAFIGVNLASPDKLGHRYGPTPAAETLEGIESVSDGLAELAATLEHTRPGAWCMIITADHGMTKVGRGIVVGEVLEQAVGDRAGDVVTSLDGGVLYVWGESGVLSKFAQALRLADGVAEVIGSDANNRYDVQRREALRLTHPRTPPLIAVAREGYMFIESEALMEYTAGSHGTTIPSDVMVPLLVCGPLAEEVDLTGARSTTDIAYLVRQLMGMEMRE
jgi:predicted AlkP superfamily pyrophosphatase or phosphodiesterase